MKMDKHHDIADRGRELDYGYGLWIVYMNWTWLSDLKMTLLAQ